MTLQSALRVRSKSECFFRPSHENSIRYWIKEIMRANQCTHEQSSNFSNRIYNNFGTSNTTRVSETNLHRMTSRNPETKDSWHVVHTNFHHEEIESGGWSWDLGTAERPRTAQKNWCPRNPLGIPWESPRNSRGIPRHPQTSLENQWNSWEIRSTFQKFP